MSVDRLADDVSLDRAGTPSASVVWFVRTIVRPLWRIAFRPTTEGLENLPSEGAFVLVANHGAGFGAADILSFAIAWLDRFGTSRPLAGFAHPFAFRVWPISWLMGGLGAIPSTYAAGEAVLARGVPLMIFPGGDHEATQCFLRGDAVDFGGRVGFLRLAARAGVPIVPMGVRGAAFTAPVLFRTRVLSWLAVLPRIFGIKRFPVTALGALGAAVVVGALPHLGAWRFLVAWLWLISPLTLLPWVPWRLRARVGAPIAQADLGDDHAAALTRVENAVRALVRG